MYYLQVSGLVLAMEYFQTRNEIDLELVLGRGHCGCL